MSERTISKLSDISQFFQSSRIAIHPTVGYSTHVTNVRKSRKPFVVAELPKRNGIFMDDGIRRVDFVMVYADEEKDEKEASSKKKHQCKREVKERQKYFEENLELEGLYVEKSKFEVEGETFTFVKVHAPWIPLCKYAEDMQIKTPLRIYDPDPEIEKPQNRFQKVFGFHKEEAVEKQLLFQNPAYINWQFNKSYLHRYAIQNTKTYFTDTQRIEIVYEILSKVPCNPKNPKELGLMTMIEDKVYESAYPVHDCNEQQMTNKFSSNDSLRKKLHENWANWAMTCHQQPLTEVRNYFGEQIAFYFAFMEVYTKMLAYPAILGFLVLILGLIYTAFSNGDVQQICSVPDETATAMEQFTDDVAQLTMCPICQPPHCDSWKMKEGGADGCFQYTWAYRIDNTFTFGLSLFTSLWAVVFLKVWRRHEATLAAEWDTHDSEETDVIIRTRYIEKSQSRRRNPITSEDEPFIPMNKIYLWRTGSVSITILVLLVACGVLVVLVLSRIQLYGTLQGVCGSSNVDCSRWLVHGLLYVTVVILENAYNKIAVSLTELECPKTEKQFLNSLLWKVFIFQCLNDFIPLGYAAWMKGKVVSGPLHLGIMGELCDGGCMGEVTELVSVLLLLRLVIGNAMELGIPWLKNVWHRRSDEKSAESKAALPQFVSDFHLNEAEFDGVYEEYMEMMIQFMFIVLFIPALPVAALVCFMNNIGEIRVDAIKLLHAYRRPVPIRTSGIGVWNQFLDIITKCGVLCNAALFAFTSDNIPRWFYALRISSSHSYFGFVKFSLTRVFTNDYTIAESENPMLQDNITTCYYPDFRNPNPPYGVTKLYWEILTLKVAAFGAYIVIFYVLMWIINTFVSDVPESVRIKINRKKYIVTKAIEAEDAFKKVIQKAKTTVRLDAEQLDLTTFEQ